MKKFITFNQESKSVTLVDDDPRDLSTYTKEISKIMESAKVCIVESSSGNLIVKPSNINSILVSEIEPEDSIFKSIKKPQKSIDKKEPNSEKLFNKDDVIKD